MDSHHATLVGQTQLDLNEDWIFVGEVSAVAPEDWPDDEVAALAADPAFDESSYARVDLPHTVTELSWRQWDPATWEKAWSYRKHFDFTPTPDERVFIDFEAVNVTASVTLNGVRLGRHFGGYLPFSFEITEALTQGDNLLAVLVDARFNINVPPNIPIPVHSEAVDYWQPGGIYGTVTIRRVPSAFIADVVATPRDVLDSASRRVDIVCVVDAAQPVSDATVVVRLLDAEETEVASATRSSVELVAGGGEIELSVEGLEHIELWGVDSPTLYTVTTELSVGGSPTHTHRTRIGFREARFERDGFYLNGKRLYLFGANRHQHYPYAGFAMPARVQRKDVEILRNDLNCVMVRCSHYPQLSSFLDACDELGLLVWEESPGWQYVGDQQWQDRAADDIATMVKRDRNRPSVIIWGARLNETPDHPDFYARTEALVKELDDTRATSGTTCGGYQQTPNFLHDVFSYDDYSIDVLPDGDHRPTLLPPREDFPYLIAETVTSWSSPARLYRRADTAMVQQHQAMDYAHVHNLARSNPHYSGVIAWSGFDYQAGHVVNYRGMKTSGMADTFRELKPGAAMYRSQIESSRRVVLEPAFTWDPPVDRQRSAHQDNRTVGSSWGPGERAVIFSNCDRVVVTVGGESRGTVVPDREAFPHLVTAPSFVDLTMDDRAGEDLLLEGYIGDELVVSRRFSGTHDRDSVALVADDDEIVADGLDATRVALRIVDEYGEPRGHSEARVALAISGPGRLIGEPVFDFEDTGAVGAVWIRSTGSGDEGLITLRASHPVLGSVTCSIHAVAPRAS